MQNQLYYKIFLNFILAFLYVLTGKLSTIIFVSKKIITFSVFIPEGIALAFALYFGKSIIPGIFLGQVILALINHLNIFEAIGIGIINSLEALIAIYLFNKFKLSTTLKNFKDFFYLIGIIIFILQPFSTFFGNLVLSIGGKFNLQNMFYWWIGNVLGQILFTPFLLILFNNLKKKFIKRFLIDGIIFSFIVFLFVFLLNIKSVFILLIISSSLILYILITKGLLEGLFLNIVLYYEIIIAIIFKRNIFSTYTNIENAINFDLFIVYNTILIYIIGILFEKEKNSKKELEKIVKQITKENKQQFEQILNQRNLVAKAEIINMLAHQWRQPLNNISLISDLIYTKSMMNNLTNEDIKELTEKIKKETLNLSNTIEKLTSLNKDLANEEFNIKEVILSTLNKIDSKNIKVKLELNDYIISFNKNALSQILLTLLQNSKEVLEDKENKEIEIKTLKKDKNIILIIKDNGKGIKNIDKIFDPYYSTKDKNKRGLSLFIVKTLIDKLGATIEVKNDNGALFKIIFKGK